MRLTHKYRPTKLEHLIGQKNVVDVIEGMLRRNKPAQTIMLQGPYGCGKTSTARLIARYLNCEAPTDTKAPCGVCASCQLKTTDYVEINAAESRGIEAVRSLIDQAHFMPASNYRVFVLDEAHQLTAQAVQALLKITEEPPRATVFILCTTDPQRFPPALASRCLRLTVRPLTDDAVVGLLQTICESEAIEMPADVLRSIAVAAAGHARDAIVVLEGVVNALAGQPDADLDALVYRVATETIGQSPEQLAAEILLAAYQGKFTPVMAAILRAVDYIPLLDAIRVLHLHSLRYRLSAKLKDPEYNAWYERLAELLPFNHLTLIDGYTLLNQTSQWSHEMRADAHAVTDLMLRFVRLFAK